MQSHLIISKTKELSEEEVNKICREFNINNFDIVTLDKSEENSIGIEDIRNIQSKIYLKPLKGDFKAAIIKSSEKLTTEAQNALLKTLEEPPANTILILTASSKELFLPTVLSRCKIIEIKEKTLEFSEKDNDQFVLICNSLSSCEVGERLKIAQDAGKTKEEVIKFLEKMILAARHLLIENINTSTEAQISKLKDLLVSLNKTYKTLKTTNANQRLTVENLFIHF